MSVDGKTLTAFEAWDGDATIAEIRDGGTSSIGLGIRVARAPSANGWRDVGRTHRRTVGWVAACVVFGATQASAQWSLDPTSPTLVADASAAVRLVRIATAPDRSTYVGWMEGNSSVRLARLDSAGNSTWGIGHGIVVSSYPNPNGPQDWSLIADREGNAVMTFADARDGSDWDVFAYRVSPTGAMLWGANGIQLSKNFDSERFSHVVEASNGDFVFAWSRFPSTGESRVWMQRLTPAGVPQLPAGGLPVVSYPGEWPDSPILVACENDDVIMSWIRSNQNAESPRHLWARRFRPDGSSPWTSHVVVFDLASLQLQYRPTVLSDGHDGAVVGWSASPTGLPNSFVQRLSPTGQELYFHNGVAVATFSSTPPFTYHANAAFTVDEKTGDTFAFWEETLWQGQLWGIYGQRFDASGLRQWGDSGKPLLAMDATRERFLRAEAYAGGAVVTYIEEKTGVSPILPRVRAFRCDAMGSFVGPTTPVMVATNPTSKTWLTSTIDCLGNLRVTWDDDEVFVQAIRADLQLGATPVSFTNLGGGLAGSAGLPALVGEGDPCEGSPVTLTLTSAAPNAATAWVLGVTQADLPTLGTILIPAPDVVLVPLVTNGQGEIALTAPWPSSVPSSSTFYFQVLIADPAALHGVAFSNGLKLTVP